MIPPLKLQAPLNAGWAFHEPKSKQWLSAEVPGCIHTDLLRHRLIPDPFWGANELDLQWIEECDWKYRCEFEVAKEWLDQEEIDLVADGLDTLAVLKLNGKEIARTANMFIGYRFPVKNHLKAGTNLLEVEFASPMPYIRERQKIHNIREWNDAVGGCSNIRKEQCSFGWDWGPRFATSGIYLPIRLEAWSFNRIEWVRVEQHHADQKVLLSITPELAREETAHSYKVRLTFDGQLISEGTEMTIRIDDPKLWWPNGHGAQPLYTLEVELLDETGTVRDTWKRRIGLRSITLDRHPDEYGETFEFLVNGRPIFAKGANWIPAHSFVSTVTRETYDNLLTSAVRANMNMLRVWGGGIYEPALFLDLCDEKGLLVWQDFMFACALYPGTDEFLKLVEEEAKYQVKRHAHHASLALWCGNNELEQMAEAILATPQRKAAYETIFYQMLPAAVERYSPSVAYWPSSPHNPEGYEKGHNNENAGDSHFWEVWHARKPVKTYETKKFRFCSEFGMQSYSSPEIAATFCPPEDFNVFGPAMENHQKNSAGNQIILDYISRLYRFPKDYETLAYLSQLNQAYCMKVGIEHFRRSMPRTMGALYWQLNDCWPVFSWSSIEFGGKWKALHWSAKRFFAPALVSAHIPGEEKLHIGNMVVTNVDEVHLYSVYDGLNESAGELSWRLFHLDGRVLEEGKKEVTLHYGQSKLQHTFQAKPFMKKYGVRNLYLRIALTVEGKRASADTVFLTAPRFLNFERAAVEKKLRCINPGVFELELKSSVFQHQVTWDLPGVPVHGSDNYFDLIPGEAEVVTLEVAPEVTADSLLSKLRICSLVDSYH